jgi:lipopolysaccharide transport system ATP-binding protein
MIRVDALCKTFKLYNSPADRLKEIVTRRNYRHEYRALQGVSFEVERGMTLGVIGQNGAGKSTLLKILAGILLADSGKVEIDGKIAGLLELGTGFNFEFSGWQNIFLNGSLLGMSKDEIYSKLEQIIEFTELSDFIHRPLKTYSSGMIMRLAFAIAIHADPNAFVVDEALSVGDAYFQQKCTDSIKQFKKQGGSIIFVSHDMNAVKMLCDRALLLDHGMVIENGNPEEVVRTYNFLLAKKSGGEEIKIQDMKRSERKSYGNFNVEITDIQVTNREGVPADLFTSGEACNISIRLYATEYIDDLTVGILIRDRFGQDIFGTNTHHLTLPILLEKNQSCKVRYSIPELNIGPGNYTLSVAAHGGATHIETCYHWIDLVKSFQVLGDEEFFFTGISRLRPKAEVLPYSTTKSPIGTMS